MTLWMDTWIDVHQHDLDQRYTILMQSRNPTCNHVVEFENGYVGPFYAVRPGAWQVDMSA